MTPRDFVRLNSEHPHHVRRRRCRELVLDAVDAAMRAQLKSTERYKAAMRDNRVLRPQPLTLIPGEGGNR